MERVFETSALPIGEFDSAKAKATLSAAQSVAVGATDTVAFDSEEFDTGADLASGVFTAPSDGYYLIAADLSAGDTLTFTVSVDGTSKESKSGTAVTIFTIHHLDEDDTVKITAHNGTAAAVDIAASSSLIIAKLA